MASTYLEQRGISLQLYRYEHPGTIHVMSDINFVWLFDELGERVRPVVEEQREVTELAGDSVPYNTQ